MSELTRRRDTSRNEETWPIFLEDVHIGTIGRRAGVPTDAEQWGWRCGFPSGSRRGRAEGTAADFAEARSQFEAAWPTVRPSYTDADFADYRRARAWTAWKQAMWETGCKLPTQTQEGHTRCFCGAEIDIASMDGHVTAAHRTETADVLVWTASHPHGFMALSASQMRGKSDEYSRSYRHGYFEVGVPASRC